MKVLNGEEKTIKEIFAITFMEESKYTKGKIYKLIDKGYNKCYIGSTTETLSNRMAKHRNSYKRYFNNDAQRTSCFDIFDEFGMQNCKIELIENYPCISKEELTAREGYHIKNAECVNKLIAGRKQKEYYKDTQEQRLEYAKKYRQQNAEKLKEKEKAYRESHKREKAESDKLYKEKNKQAISEQNKLWREQNQEKLKETNKQYRLMNQEKIRARKTQRVLCECGCYISRDNLARHRLSLKHLQTL